MMQKLRRYISIVCLIGVLFVSFILYSFASYDDIFSSPAAIPINKTKISDWSHSLGSGTVTINNTGSVHLVDSAPASNIFSTSLSGIVSGKTYILTGKVAFGTSSGRIKLGFAGMSTSDIGVETFSYDNPTYWEIDDTTKNNPSSFSWSFVPKFTEVLGNNSLDYYIGIEVTQNVNSINFNVYDFRLVCLDDILYNQLKTVIDDTDELETLVQQIIDEFQIHNDRMNTVNSNLVSIAQRIAYIYNEISPEFSDFEDEYGSLFTVAIYEAIREGFGLDEEPETYQTEPALESAVNQYHSAESQLMVDYGADLGNALSSGSGAASSNGAMPFIKNAIQSLVLDNNKISVFIMFALSFGLIVLVLGRRITR